MFLHALDIGTFPEEEHTVPRRSGHPLESAGEPQPQRRITSQNTSDVAQTVSRALPLALRRANIFRPPFVLIRFLNPWSLFLFKLDGSLKVVDIATLLHLHSAHKKGH